MRSGQSVEGRQARRQAHWRAYLGQLKSQVSHRPVFATHGTLVRATGLVLEAAGIQEPVGAICDVLTPGQEPVLAEVVGFAEERVYLMPYAELQGVSSSTQVVPRPALPQPPRWGEPPATSRPEDRSLKLPMGPGLLGRVLDPQGRPMDGGGPLPDVRLEPMARRPINAMEREPVREALDTGVRAINAVLSVGRGQRLGLFAGTGVGKSVLLGMMARYTKADVIVVGLIGERGREVKEFVDDILGPLGRQRSVVVAAPADAPALVRLQGAHYASAIAEHFREQGRHVLLLMDSLTRYAMAQREIALAIGEPPATKGYPPSCFAKLPSLVERSGNSRAGGGSITAFYTVLTEGDDPQDPIADAARGILDGHIVLSRELAESGHFPAIDIERSISRVMNAVVGAEQVQQARRLRQWLSRYNKARDLIQIGAYVPGHDAELDAAVNAHPRIQSFLQQDWQQAADLQDSCRQLRAVTQAA